MHAPKFHTTWRKSSFSADDAECVEIAFADRAVGVRDSKNQEGPLLAVAPTAWAHLVTAVR